MIVMAGVMMVITGLTAAMILLMQTRMMYAAYVMVWQSILEPVIWIVMENVLLKHR